MASEAALLTMYYVLSFPSASSLWGLELEPQRHTTRLDRFYLPTCSLYLATTIRHSSAVTAITNEAPMPHGHRQPSPRRNRRRHSAHRERSCKRIFKERFKEEVEYDVSKPKAKRKATDWKFVFVKFAALQWKIGEPLPERPSRSHKGRPKPNRDRFHRERSPELRGRHRHHHGSRRELRDASYHRWPHGSSISTPRPTRPKSPHSQARPHARRLTRLPKDDDGHSPLTHAPSDSEEESTASLRGPQPQPQGVPTTVFKHPSTDPDKDRAKDRPDVPPSLHATLDTDLNDTAPDSDEDDAGDSCDPPPSSHKKSNSDEDEGSNFRSSSSDLDGDEEENVRQVAILPLQVVKVDLGDTLPNSEENRDASLSSSPPDTSEEVENIRNAATSPHQVAHVDLSNTNSDSEESQASSDSDESEDEDPVTDLSAPSVDASPEDEGEVDDSLDQDEGYAITPPITSPEKLETASAIASIVLPSSQEDVIRPGASKAEFTASHNASGTATPDPQPQPSSLTKPSYSKAVRSIKGRIDLYPGLIVRRNVGNDDHPYLITQIDPAVVAHLCTSRPRLLKFTNQYKEKTETHFCYLGGRKEKFFHTNGISKPEVAELDIIGKPMPYKTYIELEKREPFDPNDFVRFGNQKRELTPKSLEKFRDLYNLHGCKRVLLGASPPRNRKYSWKNLRPVTPRRTARRPPPRSKRRRQRR
ncbi:hypothetical protein EDB81DRAFT_924333 [Dactylonectria macrodidyma]|uniref:Uncharacterized protein n=1 Tax=Dactylonectria macrodidyma TaxID=307937 RepID=A0A9P9FGF1_9HYPO|nr:hypothetical protein EDB81DRAFT_924333 [Dactylonectria macrodidyma]